MSPLFNIYQYLFSFIDPYFPVGYVIGLFIFVALFYIGIFALCVYIYYRIFVKNTAKKYKIIPIMIPFVLFITYRAFEEHGFCWSETRFLSDNELIARAEPDLIANDPYCCMIVEGRAYLYPPTNLDKVFNFLWGGDTHYYEYILKRLHTNDKKWHYSIMGGGVNSCGHYNISGYGEEITEQQFNQFRQKAEIKWQNK
jgi:hypothetical protein